MESTDTMIGLEQLKGSIQVENKIQRELLQYPPIAAVMMACVEIMIAAAGRTGIN